METLTDRQKLIANTLIDWAREHKGEAAHDMIIEENELAKLLGDTSWKRANNEDLFVLCAYCRRKEYPMIPLLVVIPGLRKPEKPLMTHAFKATLPAAENAKRWDAALKDIKKTKVAIWDEFKKNMQPASAE